MPGPQLILYKKLCGNLPRPKNSPRGCFCPAVRWTRGPGFSIPARVTFYARHLLKSAYKEKSTTSNEVVLLGDPCVHLPGDSARAEADVAGVVGVGCCCLRLAERLTEVCGPGMPGPYGELKEIGAPAG